MTITAGDLYRKSIELLEHLINYEQQKHDRDAYIEDLNEYIDQRERIIENLQQADGIPEKDKWAARVVETEKEIKQRLDTVLSDLRKDREIIKKKKQKNRSYAQPFQGVSKDGMFLDQRK